MVEKILAIVKKGLDWVTNVGGGVIDVLQAVVKFVKGIVTLAVDILCPIFGDNFDNVVYKVRDVVNVVDKVLEKVKDFLLKVGR